MSKHFTANQYQNAFIPHKLCNYEVPSMYQPDPRSRSGYTRVIATDRGHMLPGQPRSQENPWGNFVGTWDLPKKIPGNCARVNTARTTYAQQKLQEAAHEASRVLSGKVKNESRKEARTGGNVEMGRVQLNQMRPSEGLEAPTREEMDNALAGGSARREGADAQQIDMCGVDAPPMPLSPAPKPASPFRATPPAGAQSPMGTGRSPIASARRSASPPVQPSPAMNEPELA